MNIYGVIALVLATVVFAFVFGLVEPVGDFLRVILDMRAFESYTLNDPFLAGTIRIFYLLAIAVVVRLVFWN